MPLAIHQTLNYPGPTEGVTLLGSNNDLTSYTDVTTTVPTDQQVAVLSIIVNYMGGQMTSDKPVVFADEDENVLFVLNAGISSANEYGFPYPPLLPPGKKLKTKAAVATNETNLVIYVQYMFVPV